MNESPELQNDPNLRLLLAESDIEESPELLDGLRLLRSFRGDRPAPEPTGELAALLQGPVLPPAGRSRRRGIVLGFALAGAMAAGASGVAANDDLRLTCESLMGGGTVQVPTEPADRTTSWPLPAETPDTAAPAAAPSPAPSSEPVPAQAPAPEGVPAPEPAPAPEAVPLPPAPAPTAPAPAAPAAPAPAAASQPSAAESGSPERGRNPEPKPRSIGREEESGDAGRAGRETLPDRGGRGPAPEHRKPRGDAGRP